MENKENIKAYAAWISICIIWGTTYLAIRIGVEALPPVLFAGLRWLIAGPILFVILKAKGYKQPEKKDLTQLAVVGILLLGVGNGLVVFAEQWVPSGLTALLITTVPFWMVGLESLMIKESRLNMITLSGLLLGLAGVTIIFGIDLENLFNPSYLGGVIGLMLAVIGWSIGTIYSKHKKISVHPLMGAAVQMIIAGVLLTALGLALGEASDMNFTHDSAIAFAYLIVFGSLIGYASYIYAIAHLPVSLVSTYAYVNPVIALFLGWMVLGEHFSPTIIISAFVILVGVAVVKKGTGIKRLDLRGVDQK